MRGFHELLAIARGEIDRSRRFCTRWCWAASRANFATTAKTAAGAELRFNDRTIAACWRSWLAG